MQWSQSVSGKPDFVVSTLDTNPQTPEPVRDLIKTLIAQVMNPENVMVSTSGSVDTSATPPRGAISINIQFTANPA